MFSADAFFSTFSFFFGFALVFVIIARSQTFSKWKPGHYSFNVQMWHHSNAILHDTRRVFKISTYAPIQHDSKCHFLLTMKKEKNCKHAIVLGCKLWKKACPLL
jgi:hypothetical protein